MTSRRHPGRPACRSLRKQPGCAPAAILTDTIMAVHAIRRNPLLSRLVCAALVAGVAAPAIAPNRACARQSGVVGIPEDDPFADELNPFGSGKQPARPATPPEPPKPPPVKLPVPFPERTLPGDPAERPPQPRRDTAPRPQARPEPQRDLRGLEPFPEAESPTAEVEPSPAEELLLEAEKLDLAGKLEEARDVLRKVVKLDPKLTIGHLALGVINRRLGDFRGSVDACSAGLRIDPQDPELYLRRGIAWFHLGLHGIALEDFEDAAGIAYDDPRPELWRGLALIELDRPLEAINAYASAIRRDRTFMIAYLNRGLAYLSTGEPRKAEFDFDLAIRHNPKDVRAWFNRGVAQAAQGRYADAVESYSAALELDPKHEPSRRNRTAAERMVSGTRR
ncbi:MAG: tetratricopeptide repeat protein [Planctomycetia bacterium]